MIKESASVKLMRFFCCVISCFVVCHFVFCFMPFRMPSRLYCSFPLPLLFIRFVEGEVTIKLRIGRIMRVLSIRFVEGRVAIHSPLVLWGKVHHILVGMSRRYNLPQIMR